MRHPIWMLFREAVALIWIRCRHPRTHDEYRVVADWVIGRVWVERCQSTTRYQRAIRRAEEGEL